MATWDTDLAEVVRRMSRLQREHALGLLVMRLADAQGHTISATDAAIFQRLRDFIADAWPSMLETPPEIPAPVPYEEVMRRLRDGRT
jgi:hypothetical protein